ncbi:alpha/beta fold hydrolase [Thalassolituus sp. LLYu03]|uniref:alpha/beta fold hydrolase n=1 Tax=Thalassolituus sp. LLYu03 TaxID=3421656 RepID=UPI003D2712EC
MKHIRTKDGIDLAFERMGKEQDPAVILIMGLGAQMRIWPDSLCQAIVARGYQVIRFDNRDVGNSTALEHAGNPSLVATWLAAKLKRKARVPYTLKDMARDVIALMDALHIDSAHLVGASMGGMIAQILAAKHKKRVRSLTSMMSSATSPGLPDAKLRVLLQLARRPTPFNREASIRYTMRMNRLIGSPAYPMDEMELRALAETSFERSSGPGGFKRQLVAITAAGDRSHLLSKIKVPTLVIHGSDDPLIPARMGEDTAAAIRKAKLRIIQGMGHDLPPALVPTLAKMIGKHLKKSEKRWLRKQEKERIKTTEQTGAAEFTASPPTSADTAVLSHQA